ncbi:uncharacterized protein LOC116108252 [Pistacia vera]|uniref:uncharacterized protein LOC116108252 n=1 Tax=Pistacia vera TaxID=55513 RepID=UPI0012638AA9|nr:uncharacterized protein LOC116108252 [Pistacia vera]
MDSRKKAIENPKRKSMEESLKKGFQDLKKFTKKKAIKEKMPLESDFATPEESYEEETSHTSLLVSSPVSSDNQDSMHSQKKSASTSPEKLPEKCSSVLDEALEKMPITTLKLHKEVLHATEVRFKSHIVKKTIVCEANVRLEDFDEFHAMMKERNWLGTVTSLIASVQTLVQEFYANFGLDNVEPNSNEHNDRVYVRRHWILFTKEVVRDALGLKKIKKKFDLKSLDLDKIVKVITGGSIVVWPRTGVLQPGVLTLFYRLLFKMSLTNWSPSMYNSTVISTYKPKSYEVELVLKIKTIIKKSFGQPTGNLPSSFLIDQSRTSTWQSKLFVTMQDLETSMESVLQYVEEIHISLCSQMDKMEANLKKKQKKKKNVVPPVAPTVIPTPAMPTEDVGPEIQVEKEQAIDEDEKDTADKEEEKASNEDDQEPADEEDKALENVVA